MFKPRILFPMAVMVGLAYFGYQRMQPPRVRTARVETGQVVEVVYAVGLVKPDTETRVAVEATGRIVALGADEGDMVRVGQLLARLDDTDARIRVDEASRKLDAAIARLRQAEAPEDPLVLTRLEAQVRAAESRAQGATAKVAAARTRVETSRSALAAVESAVESARARVRAARSSQVAAESEIESAQERILTAEAEMQQARSSLEGAFDLQKRRAQLLKEGAIAERLLTEAKTAVETAEAALQAAGSRVKSARKAVATAGAAAEAARAQAEDAASALNTAQANVATSRAQVTEAEGGIPELERQAEAARGDVESLRAQLDLARRGERAVDLEPWRSEVRTQEESVRQFREQLSRFTVLSPVTGRVTSRAVDPGDYLPAGGRLMTVANEAQVYVQADVDEADIASVRNGAETAFQVDALPGKSFTGKVSRIGRAADRATKTYPVEIRSLATADGLRIGMTADVNIRGRTDRAAVLAPPAALQSEKDTIVAWVLGPDQRVRRRPVKTRAKDTAAVQILAGLSPGEVVILQPPAGLQDGQRVLLDE